MDDLAFDALVKANNGKAKPFKQDNYIMVGEYAAPSGVPDIRKGVCRTLCILYLIKNFFRAGETKYGALDLQYFANKHFFQAINQNQIPKTAEEKGRWTTVAIAQGKGNRSGLIDEAVYLDAMRQSVEDLSHQMLKGTPQVSFSAAHDHAKEIDKFSDTTMAIISTGGHMVAVVNRQKKFKFFEPNNGQVTFTTHQDCLTFVKSYLKEVKADHITIFTFV
jgi:hypothetical protein